MISSFSVSKVCPFQQFRLKMSTLLVLIGKMVKFRNEVSGGSQCVAKLRFTYKRNRPEQFKPRFCHKSKVFWRHRWDGRNQNVSPFLIFQLEDMNFWDQRYSDIQPLTWKWHEFFSVCWIFNGDKIQIFLHVRILANVFHPSKCA